MHRERDKVKKISYQLIDHLLFRDFKDFNLDVTIEDNVTKITIKGKYKDTELNFEKMKRELQGKRADEYEDYYDELLGQKDGDGLKYIGYLCDKASVDLQGDLLVIKLERNNH